MSVLSRLRPALLLAAIAAVTPAALGADPAAPAKAAPAASSEIVDRLFLAFSQDAALVKSQWWEGQVEYSDGKDNAPNIFLVRGVAAFRPIKNLEVGGSFGMGDAHASGNLPDGTGATDLDVYAKWVFPNVASNTNFSAGMLLTLPTGDDTAGLGYNSFASQLFGGVRHKMDNVVLGGHIGVRFNGDGHFQDTSLTGKTSFEMAVSALFPLANHVSLVGEASIETDRFDGVDASTQLLFGANWRAFGRGMLRGAVAGGLTGGAANYRVLLSYAYTF